jgi:hypothetical protein
MQRFPHVALASVIVGLGLVALAVRPARGEEVALSTPAWGVETELVWPFIPGVGVFQVQGSRAIYAGGEVLLGVYLRPDVGDHDVVEEIDEYLVNIGLRQFIWRGLHAELMLHAGYAWGENNKIDGQDYADVAVLLGAHAGYRFDLFGGRDLGVYVLPQVGYVAGLYTNIGPREDPDRFVTAKLLAGVRF